MNEPCLQARGLHHRYADGPQALNGLDLDLHGGEFLAILGPNGAGKSTLLRTLAGLLRTVGDVRLDGRELHRISARERARLIAVVPQGLRALPDFTLQRFVLAGRYAHLSRFQAPRPVDWHAVTAAITEVNLLGLEHRLLNELSGGQRQRALIARALAQEARILLVDEPTAALDAAHQLSVFAHLHRLTQAGKSVLVVTHDWNLASQFADRLLLMHEGRIAAMGTPAEVLCAEVLAPIYGSNLLFGSAPDVRGAGTRPFVLPWAGVSHRH